MSILCIADDNELDQRIIKLNLIRYPIFKHVLHFYNGPQLINYLNENRRDNSNLPDMILLSLNIAQSNNWNVLDTLQSIYPTLSKKVSVYMISSSIVPKDISKAMSYEFVKDFITKPVTKDILIAISTGSRQFTYR
ncbi:MAG TPA: response regulator [Mucilaginibacter sp.]|jgi:CheY-like chemotaxis protein